LRIHFVVVLGFSETSSHYIVQAGFKLTILLPLLSSAGIIGMNHQSWLRIRPIGKKCGISRQGKPISGSASV
jgi:hypothetical protein